MSNYLAVDLGAKRTGLAWCGPAQLIETLRTVGRGELEGELKRLGRELEIECLVFGIPLRRGKIGEAARKVRRVAYALAKVAELPLVFVDESETTDEARDRFPEIDKDAAAAALILSRFLADGEVEPRTGAKGIL